MGTKTANYDFWKPEIDGDESQWGSMLNANWDSLDALLLSLTGESKGIIIENPTSSEDLSYFFTDVAITVSKLLAVLVGSATPSVTWTIRFAASREDAGTEVVTGGTVTTSTTTGSDVTTFDNAAIPANSHVWVETTAKSGTVDSININLFYNED